MPTTVFLDTNVFLHYKSVELIDWLKILQADSVIILVPPITIHELNKQKETHHKAIIRKRAGDVQKKLNVFFASENQSQINNDVTILFEDRDPLIDFHKYQLSRDIQDDQLIASIIMYRNEKPDVEIRLVTSDAGLTLLTKAKRHNITAIMLPESYKLPVELDPEQEQIKKLEQEIRELKLKEPILTLSFSDGNQYYKRILPRPRELTSSQIEQKLIELQKLSPKLEERISRSSELRVEEVIGKIGNSLDTSFLNEISPEDINNFNAKLDIFYNNYIEYIKKGVLFENQQRRTIKVELTLRNDGSAPAEDIDIFMHFPDGFSIFDENGYPKPPGRPKPPAKPKSMIEKLSNPLGESMSSYICPTIRDQIYPDLISTPSNVSFPDIKRTNSYNVDVHVQRIKHKLYEELDPLYIVFESFDGASSFNFDYEILAADLRDKISGKLHIIVEKEEEKI
jgi:predicted nucleic acid-binding protein